MSHQERSKITKLANDPKNIPKVENSLELKKYSSDQQPKTEEWPKEKIKN